jgi:hypothetical protein
MLPQFKIGQIWLCQSHRLRGTVIDIESDHAVLRLRQRDGQPSGVEDGGANTLYSHVPCTLVPGPPRYRRVRNRGAQLRKDSDLLTLLYEPPNATP